MWEDIEGQESFPVSAGFELTTLELELLVQENNATTQACTHPHIEFKLNHSLTVHLGILHLSSIVVQALACHVSGVGVGD